MPKTTILTLLGVIAVYLLAIFNPNITHAQHTTLEITQISTNAADYTAGKVPQYAKFEITFQVENPVAGNFQLPYDPNLPPGLDPTYPKHQGISVDALFLPPGQAHWNQAYQQPAFFYQHFDQQIKKDQNGAGLMKGGAV